jgi:hypothetical protein
MNARIGMLVAPAASATLHLRREEHIYDRS